MTTRIYSVQTPKGPRLVRAYNKAAAIHHAAADMITAEVASQDDLVRLIASGAKVEEPDRKGKSGAVMAELPAADPT